MSNSLVAKRIVAWEYFEEKPDILDLEDVYNCVMFAEYPNLDDLAYPELFTRFGVSLWEPFRQFSLKEVQENMESLYSHIVLSF